MEAAVTKGPHSSVSEDDTISKIQFEAQGKSSTGVCNYSEVELHKTELTVKLENSTIGNDTTQELEI